MCVYICMYVCISEIRIYGKCEMSNNTGNRKFRRTRNSMPEPFRDSTGSPCLTSTVSGVRYCYRPVARACYYSFDQANIEVRTCPVKMKPLPLSPFPQVPFLMTEFALT